MPTKPRAPSDHYQEALRCLGVAEGSHEPAEDRTVAALCAVAYAMLAAAPRRALRIGPRASARWIPGAARTNAWSRCTPLVRR
jgi:hypothetical protein